MSASADNHLYPLFIKLNEVPVLLVGGGYVALEKLQSLLGCSTHANITVVATFLREEVKELLQQHPHCTVHERAFEESDLDGKQLVILATDDKALHVAVKQLTAQRNILTNVADTPDLCDLYLGSVVNKGHVRLGVSTNGQSPTLAKRLKVVLNEAIPDDINDTALLLNAVRKKLSGNFTQKVKQMNEITRRLIED